MTNPQYETLILEEQGAVDWLTLNRPDSLNALNPTMVAGLTDYFRGLARRQDRRIVVLKGADQAYCAGLDIKSGGATEDALKMNIDIGSLEAAIALEDRNQILCRLTADCQEAMAAFTQRRTPEFRNE